MKRLSSVHFVQAKEEEDEDEDLLNRTSMCLSIGISEQLHKRGNHFNNVYAPDRGLRNLGGSLFGAAEENYKQSLISFGVPNKFFAESRSFLGGCDKYCKRSNAARRNSVMSYEQRGYREERHRYKPESYQRSNMVRKNIPHRHYLTESYECPSQYNLDRYERNYNAPSYRQYEERPHRKYYKRELDSYPEYGFNKDHSREKNRMRLKRQGRQFDGNNNFYNAFHNCEFPEKNCRSHKTHSSKYEYNVPRYHRNIRQTSGYTDVDYPQSYNQYEYYNPGCDSEWEYYNNPPVPKAKKYYYDPPSLGYNYDYYENRESYKMPAVRKKSVEFLPNDCEIPYNIMKRSRNVSMVPKQRYGYLDSQSRIQNSAIEIPYKKSKRKHMANYEYELYNNRSQSGSEFSGMNCRHRQKKVCYEPWPPCCPARTPHEYNPITCPSYMKCHRKSLKQKISGYFKGKKSKSRMKCCPKPSPRYCCPGYGSGFNANHVNSIGCMDGNKSLSSVSCAVVKGRQISKPACPTKSSICCPLPSRKTRCAVYPTVYRDMCSKRCCDDLECMVCPPAPCPKVNNSQCERENDGLSKCSSEYSRNLVCISCQEPQCSPEPASVEPSTFGCAIKDPPSSCCSPTNNDAGPCEQKEVVSRNCQPVNDEPIKPSTINVCLTIHTANGNLTLNPEVIATVVASDQNLACGLRSNNKLGLSERSPCDCPDEHLFKLNQVPKCATPSEDWPSTPVSLLNFACDRVPSVCKVKPANPSNCGNSIQSKDLCAENDFMSVRCKCASPVPSVIGMKPKPILSTAKCAQSRTGHVKPSNISFKVTNGCCSSCQRNVAGCLGCGPCNAKPLETENQNFCQIPVSPSSCLKKTCSTEVLPSIQKCNVPKPPCKPKPKDTKVELVCTPQPEACSNVFCSKQDELCKCRPSMLEELKKELLEALRTEQQLQAQLPFRRPTAHISLFPCVPDAQSCHQPHWSPL